MASVGIIRTVCIFLTTGDLLDEGLVASNEQFVQYKVSVCTSLLYV